MLPPWSAAYGSSLQQVEAGLPSAGTQAAYQPFTAIAVALIAYAMVVAGAMKADAWRARTPVT